VDDILGAPASGGGTFTAALFKEMAAAVRCSNALPGATDLR
jgi:hypothetical protein